MYGCSPPRCSTMNDSLCEPHEIPSCALMCKPSYWIVSFSFSTKGIYANLRMHRYIRSKTFFTVPFNENTKLSESRKICSQNQKQWSWAVQTIHNIFKCRCDSYWPYSSGLKWQLSKLCKADVFANRTILPSAVKSYYRSTDVHSLHSLADTFLQWLLIYLIKYPTLPVQKSFSFF